MIALTVTKAKQMAVAFTVGIAVVAAVAAVVVLMLSTPFFSLEL